MWVYGWQGAVDQYNCIYVKPQTGAAQYSFNIMYDQVISFFPFLLQSLNIFTPTPDIIAVV